MAPVSDDVLMSAEVRKSPSVVVHAADHGAGIAPAIGT